MNVDVAGYKKNRAERIAKQAEDWFKEVRDSKKPKDLPPMSPADRRAVHKAAEDWGLTTISEGEGRDRHIVIKPGSELSRSSVDTDDVKDAQKSTARKPAAEE